MVDFTIIALNELLAKLKSQNYAFQTFNEFIREPLDRVVILRHDIDLKKRSSLLFAKIERALGVKGTYFFRAVPKIFDETIIKEIVEMGHEVGYHYENISINNGDVKKAIEDFKYNLNRFNEVTNVTTICMHGDAKSPYDNKRLWDHLNYRDFGILGEPYFDLDFNKVLYLTDSSQRWNGHKITIRDKVQSNYKYDFKSTFDIVKNVGSLPDQIMFTFHPDRWTNNPLEWVRINTTVALKNFIKVHYLSKRAEVIMK